MSTTFCSNCGSSNPYINGKKPNFCSNCASDLNSLKAFASAPAQPTQPAKPVARKLFTPKPEPVRFEAGDDDEQTNYAEETPQLSRDDIEVVAPRKINKISVGSILGTAEPGLDVSRHEMGASAPKRSREAIKEEFEREAGKGGAVRRDVE